MDDRGSILSSVQTGSRDCTASC